jgi:hypothetical protein
MNSATERLETQRAIVAANPPRPYDLSDPAELQRLYRECLGYLHTCHKMHGTDWAGRQHAMDALRSLSSAERTEP